MQMQKLMTTALASLTLAAGTANAGMIYSEDFEGLGVSGIGSASPWTGTAFTGSPSNGLSLLGTNFSNVNGGDAFGTLFRATTATADIGVNFADNTIYTLTFDHFRRNDAVTGEATRVQIRRSDTGGILATADFAAVTDVNTVQSRQLQYTTSGGGEVGKGIRLVFIDFNGTTSNATPQAAIDNIVLTAVPEPGSLALLGLGGLLIGVRRRRS